jgi:nucleotide-binding universal stress UspA family protein
MTTHPEPSHATVLAPESLFARILIAVDGTKQSLDACRQAGQLAEPTSTVEAAVVSLFPPAAARALGVDDLAERLDRTASSALSAAAQILGPRAELRRLQGLTVDALLEETKRVQATLLAIGTEGDGRLEEIVLGGVAGELLHKTPCAVLVARPVADIHVFPRQIVVCIDGSDEAEHAFEVAQRVATRRHSTLRSVVALGGKRVELDEIEQHHRQLEAFAGGPVPALVEAAETSDLLVVGSRGLHGLRALGSVSERIAHAAPCSVLVVR